MEDQNQPSSTPGTNHLPAPREGYLGGPQNVTPVTPQPQDASQPAPSSQPPAEPLAVTSKKVIQPSAELVQAEQAKQTEQAAATPPTPQPIAQNPAPQNTQAPAAQQTSATPTTATAAPIPPKPDPSSIYPDATKGANPSASYTVPSFNTGKIEVPTAATFQEGKALGASIFWRELLVGIFVSAVVIGIQHLIKTPLILLAAIPVLFVVPLYVSYSVLKNNSVKDPFWLNFIGIFTHIVIVALTVWLVRIIAMHIPLGPILVVFGLAFAVVNYFLTKLSWGIALSLGGKIRKKVVLIAVSISMVVLLLGGPAILLLLFASTFVHSKTSTTSSIQPAALTHYNVTGNPSFSATFYKGSKTSATSNGAEELVYKTGPSTQGVTLSVTDEGPQDVSTPGYCSNMGTVDKFSFQIQHTTGFVCAYLGGAVNTYSGNIKLNGRNYQINMISFSYNQNLATVKAIFNSIVIK